MAAGDDGDRCLHGEENCSSDFDQEFPINGSTLNINCVLANRNGVVVTPDRASCKGSSCSAVNKRQKRCNKFSSVRNLQQVASPKVSTIGAMEHQTTEELLDGASDDTVAEQINNAYHDAAANGSCDGSNLQPHQVILDQVYQSLGDDDSGVGGCIQNVAQDTKTGKMKIKSGLNSVTKQDFEDAVDAASKGSFDGANQWGINQMCKNALSGVLSSIKFTLLCKLLLENFEGIKFDRLLNFGIINTRMKNGIYEHSPTLFMADTEEVWEKLEEFGTELVSLAKSLSDITKTSCYEHIGISTHSSGDRNFTVNGHTDAKMELPTVHRISTCKQCGDVADSRECLVCDSCERMHHLSCIQPPIEDIPPQNWQCSSCIGNGFQSSAHVNCAICRKLNAPEDGFVTPSQNPDICCKICRGGFFKDEKLIKCGHSGCINKYHERCLGPKQLESPGPLWYCPSCLCQACLINRDGDQIILCYGCDDSYHVYCLRPKIEEVPSKKWFCLECESGIRAVIRAKQACEGGTENHKRKKKEET